MLLRWLNAIMGIEQRSAAEWFAALPALETARLVLRPVRLRDAEDLYEVMKDPEVARYCLWDVCTSKAEAREYVRSIRQLYHLGRPSSWAIESRETGRVIGTIGIMSYSEEHRCAEVGYSLARAEWNRGLATEALSAVLDFCFDSLEINRVEAMHDRENPASGRVMEKCGMRYEGLMRSKVFNKGNYRDVCLYAILAQDREQCRKAW